MRRLNVCESCQKVFLDYECSYLVCTVAHYFVKGEKTNGSYDTDSLSGDDNTSLGTLPAAWIHLIKKKVFRGQVAYMSH